MLPNSNLNFEPWISVQSYRCVLVVMDLQQFGDKKLQKFSTEVETALARMFLLIPPDYPNFVQPRVQGRGSSERILNSNFLVCVISKKGASPQLPPVFCLILFFYFRVHVFSISRTWLSRSKEQATSPEKRASCYKDQIRLEIRRENRSKSWSPCDFHVENLVSTLKCWNKCSLYTDFLYKFFFYFLSYLWYLNIFWTLFHLSRWRTNIRGKKYTPVFPIVVTLFFSSSSPTRLRGIAIETWRTTRRVIETLYVQLNLHDQYTHN